MPGHGQWSGRVRGQQEEGRMLGKALLLSGRIENELFRAETYSNLT